MSSPSPTSQKRCHRGWILYDWANSAFATVMLTAVFPVYFVNKVPAEGWSLSLGTWSHSISGPALWGYLLSGSMLIIAVLAPYAGAVADRHQCRKILLVSLAWIGALATVFLFFSDRLSLELIMVAFAVANLGFAAANLFYNALLPQITSPEKTDALSSKGYAVGYIGGGLVLLLNFLLIRFAPSLGLETDLAVRFGFLFTGLWWAAFTVPTALWVKEVTGYARPEKRVRYWRTFAELKKHPNALLFLLAFLCYNDGIQTLITVSSVFAADELQLGQGTILGCFLMIQFLAMPGTLGCERLARLAGTKNTIFLTLGLFTGITLYARFIEHAWQFWLLGALVALVLGGSQALSRSLFSRLIPRDKSAEFFGFFAISNRFSAILGPLAFALFADLTGSTRNAVLSLTFFFALGSLLLLKVKDPYTSEGANR